MVKLAASILVLGLTVALTVWAVTLYQQALDRSRNVAKSAPNCATFDTDQFYGYERVTMCWP